MVISFNNISGNMCRELGHNLKHIKMLSLHHNNLTGRISGSLSLAFNQLEASSERLMSKT
jgi:hypothetical protein